MKAKWYLLAVISVLVIFIFCQKIDWSLSRNDDYNKWLIGNKGGFVMVKDSRFIDETGRQIIFHGLNLSGKDRKYTYEDFCKIQQWGFNCIRLAIIWAKLEPKCGEYNLEYLFQIDQQISWAKTKGLWIVLSMHQDLWGEKVPGGNGAPAWATLDEGKPHRHVGTFWGDTYFTSPMVQAAFDNFWLNKKGPDGIGIQDRFALAWKFLAQRYANETAIVGYDIFNEPFPGSSIREAREVVVKKLAEIFEGNNIQIDEEKAEKLLANGVMRSQIYKNFDDIKKYDLFLNVAEPVFQKFEQGYLKTMYQRVIKAIREVDCQHIVFIQPCVSANIGTKSIIEVVPDSNKTNYPSQAFAPHFYDIVVDSPEADQPSENRLKLIFQRLKEQSHHLGIPLLIGEWGAFQGSSKCLPAVALMAKMFEESLASDIYWDFHPKIEESSYFKILCRPYPLAIAGRISHYGTDSSMAAFVCVWEEDPKVTQPSCFYLPGIWYTQGWRAELTPLAGGYSFVRCGPEPNNGYLLVKPTGQKIERRLVIYPKQN